MQKTRNFAAGEALERHVPCFASAEGWQAGEGF
jgi:hypothetical protein